VQGNKGPAGLLQYGALGGFAGRVVGFAVFQFSGNAFAGNCQQILPLIGTNGKIHISIIYEKIEMKKAGIPWNVTLYNRNRPTGGGVAGAPAAPPPVEIYSHKVNAVACS